MRPTVAEQLAGIRSVLAQVVAPQVEDPYAADVLAGALATLGLLAGAVPELVPFLRWDTAASTAVLALIDVPTPSPPADPLDVGALTAHHEAVRALLEASVPRIRDDPAADRAFIQLVHDRSARYPFATRSRG